MSSEQTQQRAPALVFIFVTLLIDVTGLGIIIPVMPKLLSSLTGRPIEEVADLGGWLMFAFAAMQFVCSPILGSLSDRFGRRPILLASLFGFGLDYIFQAFAPSIAWLFLGRLIAGGMGASFTTAQAYIADVSTPEKRAQNFGIVGAAFGLGFIIGPVAGGLLGHFGPRVPFLAAATLALLNWLYGYFILPESLDLKHRRPFEWKRANPIGSLAHINRYPMIGGLIAAVVGTYLAAHAVQSTWTYYTMLKFSWTEQIVGYSLGVVGILVSIVQAGLIRVAQRTIGSNKSIYVGMACSTIGLVLFAFASRSWMMFAFLVPYCLGGLAGPTLQSLISNQVPANEQGELQGALTSLISITSIVGPPMMTNLFTHFTTSGPSLYFPGAPFLLGAAIMLVSLGFAAHALRKLGHPAPADPAPA
ncbi:MAG: TCR/Tet family MFS transporter [Sandaracinaceae bacterium]|nr:TCR/Tet family MFS transporter [Sandaracinaceae bacterium]